jgi:hypothetical protein
MRRKKQIQEEMTRLAKEVAEYKKTKKGAGKEMVLGRNDVMRMEATIDALRWVLTNGTFGMGLKWPPSWVGSNPQDALYSNWGRLEATKNQQANS